MNLRPVCLPCGQVMKCHQNGFEVVLDYDLNPSYYSGDLYICPNCGQSIATGFGARRDEPSVVFPAKIESKV